LTSWLDVAADLPRLVGNLKTRGKFLIPWSSDRRALGNWPLNRLCSSTDTWELACDDLFTGAGIGNVVDAGSVAPDQAAWA
jgi:hypothetical protein